MSLLLLKLALSPAVMTIATLAGRRFGPAAGGWLTGLPLTAAPVAVIVTVQHGPRFAAGVAAGFLTGVAGQAAFAVGYTRLWGRERSWRRALCAGTAAFAATGAVLTAGRVPTQWLCLCAMAALASALWLAPEAAAPETASPETAPPPSGQAARAKAEGGAGAAAGQGACAIDGGAGTAPPRDLPLRALLAGGVMLAVTTAASSLGPAVSGVVATFPLMSTLLAVFAHRREGPPAAAAVYRGLLVGLFSVTGFSAALALLLPRVPAPLAFEVALIATLAIQAASFQASRSSVSNGA
jgi:hypothetical protein